MARQDKPKLDLKDVFDDKAIDIGAFIAFGYKHSAAVMFSKTRSGAISLTVFASEEKQKFYIERLIDAPQVLRDAALFIEEN